MKPPVARMSTASEAWVLAPCETQRQGPDNLVLDGSTHQKVKGLGGCLNEAGWSALETLESDSRERLLDALFLPGGELSLSMGRVPIGASDYALEWYSHHEADGDYELTGHSIDRDKRYLLPYARAALERNPNLWFFASPWSPPVWMKEPRAYNFGTLRWTPEIRKAYALYFAKFVEAWRAEGVAIGQVHVQNEPMADQKFPSCLWTGERLRDFIRDDLGPLLRDRCPETELWLGTLNGPFADYTIFPGLDHGTTQSYAQYAGLVLEDEGARHYVAGVGYQWGGKNAIEQTHAAWPELRLMQTESECGDGTNSWAQALYVFQLLRHYFLNGVESYCWWNLVLPPGGRSTWGWAQNAPITVDPDKKTWTTNPEFHLMRHVAPALVPGAVRLGLRGRWSSHAMAFLRPDRTMVVVAANPYPQIRRLQLAGPGQTVGVDVPAFGLITLFLEQSHA